MVIYLNWNYKKNVPIFWIDSKRWSHIGFVHFMGFDLYPDQNPSRNWTYYQIVWLHLCVRNILYYQCHLCTCGRARNKRQKFRRNSFDFESEINKFFKQIYLLKINQYELSEIENSKMLFLSIFDVRQPLRERNKRLSSGHFCNEILLKIIRSNRIFGNIFAMNMQTSCKHLENRWPLMLDKTRHRSRLKSRVSLQFV